MARILTRSEASQLQALKDSPGLWSGVPPWQSDPELGRWLDEGLVTRLRSGGYGITDAGSNALRIFLLSKGTP
jgi:hypothetical protein